MWEEGVVLEDHSDAAMLGWYPRVGIRDDAPADDDGSSIGLFKAGNDAKEGCLAAAARSQNRDEFTLADAQIGAGNGLDRSEALRDTREADHRLASRERKWLQWIVAANGSAPLTFTEPDRTRGQAFLTMVVTKNPTEP